MLVTCGILFPWFHALVKDLPPVLVPCTSGGDWLVPDASVVKPAADLFMSGSDDGTVRQTDIREPVRSGGTFNEAGVSELASIVGLPTLLRRLEAALHKLSLPATACELLEQLSMMAVQRLHHDIFGKQPMTRISPWGSP